MKVVFLDIDGVLNSHAWLYTNGNPRKAEGFALERTETWGEMLDPEAVKRLNRLLPAKFVISSSWRIAHPFERIGALLKTRGFEGEVIGETTTSYGLNPDGVTERGHQIAHWIAAPAYRLGEPLESFVILDDDSDMAHLKDRHVKTLFAVGLTDADVERALAVLAAPWVGTEGA